MSPSPSPTSDPSAEAALRAAAAANDVKQAQLLVGRGVDVNAKSEQQEPAYLLAASEGAFEVLRLVLPRATVDDKDSWNGTALIRAAERGHHREVGLLVRAGIDLDHVNRIGYQAIHEAVWLGDGGADHLTTVRVLVATGVQADLPSGEERMTPLAMAQDKGYEPMVALLSRLGDPVSTPDAALLKAATDGNADAVALALRAGADLEARDSSDRTALLLAVTHDRVEAAQVLVALGADPDALDNRHDTPWLVTGVTGSVAMLEVLLDAQPDLTIVNRFGGTSLIPASERGHVEYVRRAVSTGIDINHVNELGWTALLEAVILGDGGKNHQEIVSILLKAGADRSIPDGDGVTALQHAKAKGYDEIAAMLAA